MKSLKDIRSAGIRDARAALAQADGKARIAMAFVEWWGSRDDGKEDVSAQKVVRPSAERLAAVLRAEGMEDAASFALGQWVKEGPIDPGVWLFAILLGKSFVEPFFAALLVGGWRTPNFFGLKSYGAWEAFLDSLRDRLRTPSEACDAAFRRLRLSVENVRDNPVANIPVYQRDRVHIEGRAKRYLASPDIDEAFQQPFDPIVWLKDCFLWDVLLQVRPADTLTLLGDMPHPVFMRNCFGSARLAGRPEEVGGLIRAAPDAFNGGGAFQARGAVALLLLEIAEIAIEQTVQEPDGSILVVALDNREALAPAIERCQAAMKTILDALFSRHDAIAIAWAWLERMMFRGKLRGRPSVSGGGLAVNLPTLAIVGICEHLCWRHDWKEWIGERKKLWRIYRLTSVLSVGTFGQEPDKKRLVSALNWALLEGEIDYAGIEDAIADQQNVVAAIGGRASCMLPDPVAWFAETWQKLRPIREKNWRIVVGGGKHNSVAELLMLWGFAAHGFLPAAERSGLWASLEKSLRDAWQTDALVYPTVWSNALVRLFGIFEVQKGDGSGTTEEQMANVLLPYAAASYGFVHLVDSLTLHGWPIEVIRDAVAIAGFDLGRLVRQFLATKELVIALPQANRDEIGRFRTLAETVT